MYKLGDRVQLGENWKNRNLDVEIDSKALKEKIISLSEGELRRGKEILQSGLEISLEIYQNQFWKEKMDLRESDIFPS